MILIYGMDTCPDCTYLYSQIENRKQEFEYRNIGEHVRILKEFLKIRDHSQVFDECKELGISIVWLQPGADKPSVVEKAHALDLHVIQDCVLVQLP